MTRLIVGLGNPGRQYAKTRHNIGFRVVDLLAKKNGLEFRKSLRAQGLVAKGTICSEPCILLKPLTFMNLSGVSVLRVMRLAKIELEQLLVIADDVTIGFGKLRLKSNSSSGGHNGLKSIEESLQSLRYARLKVGVGQNQGEDLSSYVLGQFSKEEEVLVSEILERAAKATAVWIEKGITRAMNFIQNPSTPSIGNEDD